MTYKKMIMCAAIVGALAVVFGAFGAHALAEKLSDKQLSSFKTGNMYHFYHSILLLIIGILYKLGPSKLLRISAWFCIFGILCFSGSLYILACKDLIGLENTMIIGPVTPIGGLLFIVSWVLLAINYRGIENE